MMTQRLFDGVRARRGWLPRLAALAAALVVAQAHAGLFDDNEARQAIIDLRQQVQDLKTANAAQAQRIDQLSKSMLDLNAQIDQLRQDLARQRGDSEVTARTLADLQRQQKDLSSGVEARISKLEPQKVNVDGQEFIAQPDEINDYQSAMDTLRQGNFSGATTAFQSFMDKYPSSGYRPSVLYWLGNAQYGQRDYKAALASFRSLISSSPDHPKVPEAMLAIANCQIEMREVTAARHTLAQLIKTYPKSEAAQAGRDRLAKLKK